MAVSYQEPNTLKVQLIGLPYEITRNFAPILLEDGYTYEIADDLKRKGLTISRDTNVVILYDQANQYVDEINIESLKGKNILIVSDQKCSILEDTFDLHPTQKIEKMFGTVNLRNEKMIIEQFNLYFSESSSIRCKSPDLFASYNGQIISAGYTIENDYRVAWIGCRDILMFANQAENRLFLLYWLQWLTKGGPESWRNQLKIHFSEVTPDMNYALKELRLRGIKTVSQNELGAIQVIFNDDYLTELEDRPREVTIIIHEPHPEFCKQMYFHQVPEDLMELFSYEEWDALMVRNPILIDAPDIMTGPLVFADYINTYGLRERDTNTVIHFRVAADYDCLQEVYPITLSYQISREKINRVLILSLYNIFTERIFSKYWMKVIDMIRWSSHLNESYLESQK